MSSVAKPKGPGGAGDVSRQGLFTSLRQASLYKPLQGRVVRQITFVAVAVLLVLLAVELGQLGLWTGIHATAPYLAGFVFAAAGLWIAYRLVNHPPFADFLIAVEAEMNKVSWPTWPELWKASLVVVVVIFGMSLALYLFDLIWATIFYYLNIR